MPKRLKSIIIIAVVILAALGLARVNNPRENHLEKRSSLMMGTYVTISALGPKEVTSPAIALAMDRMQEISVKFHHLNPKSPLYKFNREGPPITDPEIIALVEQALKVSIASDGAFDITVAPLSELWGFSGDSPRLPQPHDIEEALKHVGYRHLSIKDGKLEKDSEGVRIDLGGIAKGYAISEAVKILKANGVKSAIVDAGGDIFVLGKKDGKPWRVGITNPRDQNLLGYVEVEDIAVMSSGDYERFFIQDGKRYHHIFNPKTGYSTEDVMGVTLISPDPVLAQAWAKIPFVMGSERAMEALKEIPGMEAMVVKTSGDTLYSDAFKRVFKPLPK